MSRGQIILNFKMYTRFTTLQLEHDITCVLFDRQASFYDIIFIFLTELKYMIGRKTMSFNFNDMYISFQQTLR